MKVVILAGGRGSRISEESKYKPKPMVKIGNKPIIWHIIKYYEAFGFSEFIICAGYKQKLLKNFFSKKSGIKAKVTVADTGLDSMTGGRIKKIKKHVIKDKNFLLTYGDGLSNINLIKLINLHKKMNKIVTLSAVKPNSKYGIVKLNNNRVKSFEEKPNNHFINGGFFVISTKIFEYIKNEKNIFEFHCLPVLAKKNELAAYKHNGFWHCLDTMRDKEDLNKLWGKKPLWKIW